MLVTEIIHCSEKSLYNQLLCFTITLTLVQKFMCIWQAASVMNDVLARYSKRSCFIATTSTSGTVESLYS